MLSAASFDVRLELLHAIDSVTSAALSGCARGVTPEDPPMDRRIWEAIRVADALARSAEFDLVDSHLDWLPLAR